MLINEDYFRNIFNTVREAIIILDAEMRVLSANRSFFTTFKVDAADTIGALLYSLGNRQWDIRDLRLLLEEILPHNDAVDDFEIEHDFEGIGCKTMLVNACKIREKQDDQPIILLAFEDITERKKLDAQLLHSQKMEVVGTLAGGIAHDFNNVLHIITSYGTMVQATLPVDSTAREQMARVLIAADRAVTLSKRLLVFSRKQIADVKPVNINELIRGLQKMLICVFRENIDVTLTLSDESLPALVDAGQIEQVLMNLAVNARDAMPDGGRLTIGTSFESVDEEYVAAYGYGKPGKYILITVTDSGQGIDTANLEKIFEPFFTTKGIGEGTGLGLAISCDIIKQHCGYIKVYSEPGQGTVFKILLPLSADTALSGRQTPAPDAV